MSLFRQLWIMIILATLVAFAGSFIVSVYTARGYLEQQLFTQSNDNASSLALSMSQQSKDPATIELNVAALFDTGHFELIRFSDNHGKTLVERTNNDKADGVPNWFVKTFPLQIAFGKAQVSDGWKQAGTITVVAHSRFAYQALWEGAMRLFVWIIGAGLVCGAGLQILLNWVKKPITQMVEQAEAISERRFITIPEPRYKELKSVVNAMNTMVSRVKTMFSEQAARIDALRSEANRDPLTQLPNRNFFMGRLSQTLEDDEAAPSGILLIMRLHNLADVNRRLGRERADQFLQMAAGQLASLTGQEPDRLVARLNGADFALLAPGLDRQQGLNLAKELHQGLAELRSHNLTDADDLAAIGIATYQHNDSISQLLSGTDQALAQAESSGANGTGHVSSASANRALPAQDWQPLLQKAFKNHSFELASFPAILIDGQPLHRELLLRLRHPESNELLTAGTFMPFISRLGLSNTLDLESVRLACDELKLHEAQLAINLEAKSIADEQFIEELLAILSQHKGATHRLWFEVNEFGFRDEITALANFAQKIRPLGCKVGIKHFGRHFGSIPQLYELQLDYLKIDGSFIQGIDQHPGNQNLVKAIIGIASGHDILTIAERVQTKGEWDMLKTLGINGLSGPIASKPLN
ncbi:bifunctional diguanylate cyclase/phosphodiesterase [Janthinobacterium sp. B9-8]|uniref:bifunctional diguanylate cyclase/phosphodiesterase n=1 Tax=Janthinobacterium sp. B9-8 TaxID=1236179 RepID=UPI00061D3683|nr:EAL domain-containing protein [Janthinobacterium sp. B9-8]AMC36378.1 hypothetical protein VN23_18170 [Janthinobacterium sp. B9-8]